MEEYSGVDFAWTLDHAVVLNQRFVGDFRTKKTKIKTLFFWIKNRNISIKTTWTIGESGVTSLFPSLILTSASILLLNSSCARRSSNCLNFGLIGAIWWKMISSVRWPTDRPFKSASFSGGVFWSSFCCETDVVDGGDGGVGRGDVPLHCISRRQCSARAISAASHDGSSGRSQVNADLRPSIMCSRVTIKIIVCVDVRPGQSRVTWPDSPINAQLTITAARPRNPRAFCHVPMLATRWPKGRCGGNRQH